MLHSKATHCWVNVACAGGGADCAHTYLLDQPYFLKVLNHHKVRHIKGRVKTIDKKSNHDPFEAEPVFFRN